MRFPPPGIPKRENPKTTNLDAQGRGLRPPTGSLVIPMYETETNTKIEPCEQIPPDAIAAFAELRNKVVARTLIPWGEHCTECGWPTCYSTCDLYEPREDLKCRRFVNGMVRIECPGSLNSYLLKICFKRWGKLWARGNFRLYSDKRADRLERRDYRLGSALQRVPLPATVRRRAAWKRYAFKKRLASRGAKQGNPPTSFVLECYNPQPETVRLSLTVRTLSNAHPVRFPNLIQLAPGFRGARELTASNMPFQKLIEATPGFHRTRIPFEEMSAAIDLRSPYAIDVAPNQFEDGLTLYFGAMDFVRERTCARPGTKKVKCVVWDLDNTLWDGILVEDGPDKLRLKPMVTEIIRELDRRGILHSIASKNNREAAMQVLKRFKLDEYFLHPQISWQPKSEGIRAIARALNIGIDSLLFVDDSDFELQEVSSACPGVKVLDATYYATLPHCEECSAPVTAEAASRRQMYRTEEVRTTAAKGFGEDYLGFLRHCGMNIEIEALSAENLERVHELTQRTNQMNFSGNRYSREVLQEIMATAHLDTYVITCEDRFGSYGIVGFSIVDRREPRMTDLMFSCRVQSKRVEHAFLSFLARRYVSELGRDFLANYRRTERNAPAGRVFADLGMREIGTHGGISEWACPKEAVPQDDGICEIRFAACLTAASGR